MEPYGGGRNQSINKLSSDEHWNDDPWRVTIVVMNESVVERALRGLARRWWHVIDSDWIRPQNSTTQSAAETANVCSDRSHNETDTPSIKMRKKKKRAERWWGKSSKSTVRRRLWRPLSKQQSLDDESYFFYYIIIVSSRDSDDHDRLACQTKTVGPARPTGKKLGKKTVKNR